MSERPEYVIGPVGEKLTLDGLPPTATVRWTTLRKAQVVAAVKGRLLTLEEACGRYGLAPEEFAGWQRALQRSGIAGLRVTRLQEYRDRYEKLDGYCRPGRLTASGPSAAALLLGVTDRLQDIAEHT